MNSKEFILEIFFHIFFMVLALSILYFVIISPLSGELIKNQLEFSFSNFQGANILDIPQVVSSIQELINYLNSLNYDTLKDPSSNLIQNPVTNAAIIGTVSCVISLIIILLLIFKGKTPYIWSLFSSIIIVTSCIILDIIIIKYIVSGIQYVDVGSLFNYIIQNPTIGCSANFSTIYDNLSWKYGLAYGYSKFI
jgi:hypothetical protein